ncbi:PTS sugar transporter subunit IIB [Lactococcus hodotermopsidis]|uniref:PTS sugar transporter subunit IIB n=1 Tax=Pseudolactococcus hodotermopsidis TaxID=2709157 RepID=A0A6A0BGA3_9LACT|nr:PTS sugar transporter subunit IIB [Lactococcus hodotermopsidis]GFH43388.1 PTS sugar transporter subunit IIB [Lactococcus hodotermopsidis]
MADKTVRIFCSAGMSTSLFAQKIQQEADARGLDFDVEAYGLAEIDTEGPKADVILIGPQARYMVAEVTKKFPDTPVKDVPMQMFGLMQGDKGLDLALELIGE